jgi:head-tail adaptor
MMDNELLIKILAKQEVLEHRLNVQEKLLHILIQAVPEEQRQDLESLVKAYREFASASGDQQCTRE